MGDLTNNAGYLKTITSSHVVSALGYTPQNAATAFGGSYTDLTNKPTDISDFTDNNGLLGSGGATTLGALTDVDTTGATAGQVLKFDGTEWVAAADATTGGGGTDADTLDGFDSSYYLDYANFTNTPTIPTDVSDLTDTTNLLSGGGGGGATALGGLTDVVNTAPTNGQVLKWDSTNNTWAPADDATAGIGGSSYATEAYVDQKLVERGHHFSGDYNDLTNSPTLFSGNFADLNGKPTTIAGYGITDVPASLVDLAIADGNAGQVLTTDGNGNFTFTSAGAFNGDYNALINKPNLFSGDYNDLSNKPYIPSIAGLASTNYVDQKADYGGDKNFLDSVEFRDKIKQKASTANTTGERESLVMAIETTDDVETEVLFSDNTKIEIADGTTAMVEMHIVGSSSIGQYGVKLQAIVHRAGTNVFIIGSPARETLAEYSTWTADLDVNTTSLKVTVTGSAATTVDWTVFTNIFSVIR